MKKQTHWNVHQMSHFQWFDVYVFISLYQFRPCNKLQQFCNLHCFVVSSFIWKYVTSKHTDTCFPICKDGSSSCAHQRGNILNTLTRTSSSQRGPLGLHMIPKENHEEFPLFKSGLCFKFHILNGNVFTNKRQTSLTTSGSSFFM